MLNTLVESNPKELEQFKLPSVVVIGNDSTGKSSLLENITKCQTFPRNTVFCTKSVIRFILKNGAPKYNVSYNDPASIKNISILDKKDMNPGFYSFITLLKTDFANFTIGHKLIV